MQRKQKTPRLPAGMYRRRPASAPGSPSRIMLSIISLAAVLALGGGSPWFLQIARILPEALVSTAAFGVLVPVVWELMWILSDHWRGSRLTLLVWMVMTGGLWLVGVAEWITPGRVVYGMIIFVLMWAEYHFLIWLNHPQRGYGLGEGAT